MAKLLKLWSTCFGAANIPKLFGKKKMLEWMSQKIVNLKDSECSHFLCQGLVDNVSNVLLHHLLLIATHYIYTCKLKNFIPKLLVYIQLLLTSMKTEKKIAIENSTLNSFEGK